MYRLVSYSFIMKNILSELKSCRELQLWGRSLIHCVPHGDVINLGWNLEFCDWTFDDNYDYLRFYYSMIILMIT